ncbi:polyketide synthase, partial [Mycobacterium simiae]
VRHVWQGEVGTATHRWLGDHQIYDATVLPAAVHCEMALAAARTVLGEASEVRDIRFEQMLLLGDETPITVTATIEAAGVVPFEVETNQDGQRERNASAVLHAAEDDDQPPVKDVAHLLAAHPNRVEGADIRQWMHERGRRRFGPAFTGLAGVHTAEGTGDTMLAEVSVPGSIRTQQGAYGVHPSLLDACFQSVAVHRSIRNAGNGGRLMPLGVRRLRAYGSARNARYCYTTVTACGSGIEADLDVIDENGTVLLAVRGLQIGTGASESSERDRVLNERLL